MASAKKLPLRKRAKTTVPNGSDPKNIHYRLGFIGAGQCTAGLRTHAGIRRIIDYVKGAKVYTQKLFGPGFPKDLFISIYKTCE